VLGGLARSRNFAARKKVKGSNFQNVEQPLRSVNAVRFIFGAACAMEQREPNRNSASAAKASFTNRTSALTTPTRPQRSSQCRRADHEDGQQRPGETATRLPFRNTIQIKTGRRRSGSRANWKNVRRAQHAFPILVLPAARHFAITFWE
jgi:hypothetical protein